jgi:hypothetical protein
MHFLQDSGPSIVARSVKSLGNPDSTTTGITLADGKEGQRHPTNAYNPEV